MKSLTQFICKSLMIISALIAFTPTSMAVDGTVGATSTGSSDISVYIGKVIMARSFVDFGFGSYVYGSGDLNANDDLNISSNYGGITYQVTLSGSGSGGAFTIDNGGSTMPYEAYFNDATGITGRVQATSGTPLTAQTGIVTPLTDTTLNANLSIVIDQTDLDNGDAGTYSGTITAVFEPE